MRTNRRVSRAYPRTAIHRSRTDDAETETHSSTDKTLRIAAERTLNRQDREVELGWRRWEQALAMATIKDQPPPF